MFRYNILFGKQLVQVIQITVKIRQASLKPYEVTQILPKPNFS